MAGWSRKPKKNRNARFTHLAIMYPVSDRMSISDDAQVCSNSTQLGSDEDREILCDLCAEDGQHNPANGYCTNCNVFLCEHCYKCHKTNKTSRNHVLLDKNTMPTVRSQSREKDACSIHGSVVEYYCSSCDQFGCSCLVASHPKCTVGYIPSIFAGSEVSKEYQKFEERLSELRNQMWMSKKKFRSNSATADTLRERAKREMKKQRNMVNNFFDKLERQMERKIDQIRSEDEEVIEGIAKQHDSIQKEFQTKISNVERKKEMGQICQLLVYMKTSEGYIKELEKKMKRLNEHNKIWKYELFMSEEMVAMIQRQEQFTFLLQKFSVWKRRAIFRGKVNMKAESDERRCNIKGMCLLNTDLLVAADLENICVKLVELKTASNNKVGMVKMSSWPWDVTKVTDEQVAVTLPEAGLVCFLSQIGSTLDSTTARMSKVREIDVGPECRGIECSKGTLIISFAMDPGVVKILTLTGTVIQRFSTGLDGQELFVSPYYLALGLDGNIIYVSDYHKHTVTSLGRNGVVRDVYRNEDLHSPAGLAIDRTDSVFVCGSGYYNVHQMYSDLSQVQLLLDHSNSEEKPQSIAYCRSTNKICIGMEYKNCINMFKLM